jgi:hypothetical protein
MLGLWAHVRVVYSNSKTMYNFQKIQNIFLVNYSDFLNVVSEYLVEKPLNARRSEDLLRPWDHSHTTCLLQLPF